MEQHLRHKIYKLFLNGESLNCIKLNLNSEYIIRTIIEELD